MIRDWTLAPLAVAALCALWIWIVNRRPRLAGMVWPSGAELGGALARPDVSYPGDVVLGCDGRFGTIQCRTLVIAAGADVRADLVVALRVRVDGALQLRQSLTAGKRLEVRGVLRAEEIHAPRIVLRARSRTTAITVAGHPRIDRHPAAVMKGFFEHRDEIAHDDRTRLSPEDRTEPPALTQDTTDRISIVRGPAR
ncbi:MAG TPA: hypothetical protein VMV18_13080 [bacterium]|nr:hypothetical protein [bacterium]